ncbi:hypothetical protein [Anaerosinus massiliensis]|uniref:hypothetical protein n=1 Tax=Massilibacillus massiliensis TaxID=1806837 RepID=UPI000DA63E32|nr:hypothetical protein [Massilibacillus massiliensis]
MNSETLISEMIEFVKNEKQLEAIRIEKEVEIEGRTGIYPVDLFLEFQGENGLHYKIIAQVKNMEHQLNKQELFEFVKILQDVSGQVMGVIFTQPVYDKLVRDIAKDVGILLYEMGGVDDKPIYQPNISGIKVDIDEEWVKAEKMKHGLENETIPFSGDPKYMYLYNKENCCIDSIEGIFNSYVKKYSTQEEFSENKIMHSFEEEVYLQTGHALIPKIRIKCISFYLSFTKVSVWNAEDIMMKIIRTALNARLK